MGAIAGCGGFEHTTATDVQSQKETGRAQSERDTGGQTIPAEFVIDKHDGSVRSINGRTGEVTFEGTADEEDARIIQSTFRAIEDSGGRVFLKRDTYEIKDGEGFSAIGINADGGQVISDYARLRFHNHNSTTGGGIEEQVDFTVSGNNTRISGLILDGNKENRTLPTRTLGISNCEHVHVDSCIIKNGKMIDGKRGYGIGGPNNASHVTISNCILANNDSHGIHPGGPDQMVDHRFVNCSFLGNGLGIGARNGTTRTIIANNYFADNRRGIAMTGGPISHESILITGNLFSNNFRESEGSEQIMINDAFDHLRISNNVFTLPAGSGDSDQPMPPSFHVQLSPVNGAGTVEISNNHIEGGSGPGIVISNVNDQEAISLDRAIISDNYVGDLSDRNWPLVVRNAGNTLVQNNYFQQPASRNSSVMGFEAPIENLAITDNVLENVEMDVTDQVENLTVSGTIEW